MKNLKISNKLKAIILTGAAVALGSYISGNISSTNKTDVEKFYDYNLAGLYTCAKAFDGINTTVFDYKKYLEENNLVPLVSSDSFIEKFRFDDGYYLENKYMMKNLIHIIGRL